MKLLLSIVVPLSLASGAALAASAKPPTYNVEPSCRAAAKASGAKDRLKSCLASEHRARRQIVNGWRQFSAETRATCLQASSLGGSPTYTELITCLEMTRDVKKRRAADSRG